MASSASKINTRLELAAKREKNKVGPWIDDPDDSRCSMRVITATGERVAFIEKTPRILNSITKEWDYGPKGSGELCGKDPSSRKWCDNALLEHGYNA